MLLKFHTDVNIQDGDGISTLLFAIQSNGHKVLEVLQRFSANYLLSDRKGRTILHFAAMYADVRTLGLLTKTRMTGLQLDAREKDTNKTAIECAQERSDTTQEWWTAWSDLLRSVDDTTSRVQEVETDDEGEGEDTFEDALEHLAI